MLACSSGPRIDMAPTRNVADAAVDVAASLDGSACGCASCLTGQCIKLAYAVERLYVGDTDRGELPDSVGWYTLGLDLDGIQSRYAFNGECKPRNNANYPEQDGLRGIDNAWGASILPLLKADATPTKSVNAALASGGVAPLIALGAVSGNVGATTLPAFFTFLAPTTGAPFDARAPVSASPTGFANATLETQGEFASGAATDTTVLTLPIGAAPIVLPIRGLRVEMTIGANNAVSNGLMGGAIAVDDLKTAVAAHLQRQDPTQCGDAGAKVLQLDTAIDAAADLLADGAHDPTRTCDAVSFGAGFDVALVTLRGEGVLPAAAPPQCP